MHKMILILTLALLLAACTPQDNGADTVTATAAGGLPGPTALPSATLPPASTAVSAQNATPTVPAATATTEAPAPPTATPAPPSLTIPPVEETTSARGITLSEPAALSTITGRVHLKGVSEIVPFEKSLVAEIYDSEGQILGMIGILVAGEYGESGSFETDLTFNAPATLRPGRVVVYDTSEVDGSIIAEASVPVQLAPEASELPIMTLPAAGSLVALPVHIEVVNLVPDAEYTAQVQWVDGTLMERQARASSTGTLVTSVNMDSETRPPEIPTQDAVVNLLNSDGVVVASSGLRLVNPHDSTLLQPITVYFAFGETLDPVTRWVPPTAAVATAALRELSWGPSGAEATMAGLETALATPAEIAAYPPQEGWSGRAYLRSVRIVDGVAFVDWSSEMRAWGGGSARLEQFQRQVEQTLFQFPTITQVQMTIDGSTEWLQP